MNRDDVGVPQGGQDPDFTLEACALRIAGERSFAKDLYGYITLGGKMMGKIYDTLAATMDFATNTVAVDRAADLAELLIAGFRL